ncbi:Ig-like domain-containing protein [Eubacterium sp. 1001713B170207_170306_E7]|uniref:Ig-like domain-containing protein n=1 Tax=Eubacterium sp. 1001713B170207_170306_E7 TaxID=2787097 RepID=UPI00189B34B1|nr:Ig-like domain-containing protein [Eubacterium sp. 1001713B170207_170306_E7]
MKNNFFKTNLTLILSLLLLSGFSPILAETPAGDPALNEGAVGSPLTLTSSVPQDGATDVQPFTEISVSFNQNVVNTAVKAANEKAVTLWSEGRQIDADIVLSDDLIDPEDWGTIRINPKDTLKSNQEYIIKVDTHLTSTTGQHLQDPVEVHFTTVKSAASITGTSIAAVAAIVIIAAVIIGILYKRHNR